MRIRMITLLLVLCSMFVFSIAYAQEMVFSEEETGEEGQAPPPAEGPPSEALANALRLYSQEAYMEAAVQFNRVVSGETNDAPANVQKAQFFLAKCLYHLKFYQSALSIFEEIVNKGSSHLYFKATLQWLAQLSKVLPEPAGIVGLTGHYGDSLEVLSEFNRPETQDLYHELLYLMGKYWYAQGEFGAARRFFLEIPSKSKYYYHARFFAAITHVQERHAQPAVKILKEMVDKLEDEVFLNDEEERFLNLGWLSLARIYYSTKHWDSAIEAWNRVSPSSEYWLDAIFEQSWARFQLDQFDRALGNIHTLNSPFFKNYFYPESLILKAVIYFTVCDYERALLAVKEFRTTYEPIRNELEANIRQFSDNTQFFEFLKSVREGKAQLNPTVERIVKHALDDRTVLRNLEYVKLLEKEEERLNRMPPAFKNSDVGARILQDISVARSVAIDNTGELARSRYQRLLKEIQQLFNDASKIEIEVLSAKRGELRAEIASEQVTVVPTKKMGKVEEDIEHVIWPFDGEYWRDELGYYRQPVVSKCGR